MLAVDRVERSEEPLAGRLCAMGEAKELCCRVWAGVSQMVGFSLLFSSTSFRFVPKSVWIVKPAIAGVLEIR